MQDLTVRLYAASTELVEEWMVKPLMDRQAQHERLNLTLRSKLKVKFYAT